MRKSTAILLFTAALVLGTAGAASGVALTGGTLDLSIGALPPISLTQNTDPDTVSISTVDGSFTLAASVFGPQTIVIPTELFTGVPQISGLTIGNLANGNMPMAPGGGPNGGFGGVGPLQGDTYVNILQLFNLTIPLSGVGAATDTVMAGSAGIVITVTAGPWGTSQQTITGTTGTAMSAMLTGSDNRVAPFQAGAVSLVSAFKSTVSTGQVLPGAAIVSFNVPEPANLLMALVGGSVLAFAGIRRLRK